MSSGERTRVKKIKQKFGTDGIRGRANLYPMDPETVMRIGKAIGYYFRKNITKGLRF